MDDLSVTLIVKAPNQQIEDQIVQCELSWTIKKLKTYLSEVYPSKPGIQDQKLIYSGQLLADTLILKDILRRYEGQETHTVHLVCTPSKYYQYTKPSVNNITKPSPSNSIPSTSSATRSSPSTSSGDVSTATTTPKMKCDDKTSTKIKSSENAQSAVASSSKDQPTNSTNVQNQETITSQSQSSGSRLEEENQVPNPQMIYSMNNQVYAAQLAMFQQHYINYMNHYMKMYVNQMQNVDAQKMLHGQIPEQIGNNQADENNRVPPVAPEAAARGPAEPVQNVNAAEQDEGIIDRDWLDWFYVLSRLTVLLSIVYFYSSPLRFIIVFLLGCTMYLYQIGFFRVPLENNNAINNNVDPIVENNNNRRNDAQRERPPPPARENLVQGGVDNHAANIAPTQPSQAPMQMVPDRPTVLGVMWTFFTTFFASLIPEIPNAI